MIPRPRCQPFFDLRVRMRAVVVQDQMHFAPPGDRAIQFGQEVQKFLMSVPWSAMTHYGPVKNIQGSKQCARAMALVVMGLTFRNSGPQWQNGLRAVQCLNLTLFIHAEHQSLVGWV